MSEADKRRMRRAAQKRIDPLNHDTKPPIDVDHRLMGAELRWKDGKLGKVGAIQSASSQGVANPHDWKPDDLARVSRLRVTVVVHRDDGKESLTFRSFAEVEAARPSRTKTPAAKRVRCSLCGSYSTDPPPRAKETRNA
jgi:hypothetical protein